MQFKSWLSSVFQPRRRSIRSVRKAPHRARLAVEALEERWLPSPAIVTNLNDSGSGSLRAAILSVEGTAQATVYFSAGLPGTITLSSPLLISKSVSISGPGAGAIALSGNNKYEVLDLEVDSMAAVSISGLTIENGLAPSSGPHQGEGGGLFSNGQGQLSLSGLVISHNAARGSTGLSGGTPGGDGGAGQGGGLYLAGGTVNISGCTISNNLAQGGNGGNGAKRVEDNNFRAHSVRSGVVFATM
jgi:hypothetical protein